MQPSDGLNLEIGPRLDAHSANFVVIQTHLSRRFYLAVDFIGLCRNGFSSQIINQGQYLLEEASWRGNLGQRERDVGLTNVSFWLQADLG